MPRRSLLTTAYSSSSSSRINLLATLVALFAIGAVTLTPTDGQRPFVGAYCLLCGQFGTPDLVLNVLLFIPLGLALGHRGMRPLHVLGIGLAMSAGIEVAQTFIPGRGFTLRDILTNAVGCGLGGSTAARLGQWLAPSARTTALLWAAVFGLLAAAGLTGVLVRFMPADGTYYAHWVPQQGHLEHWKGSVVDVQVGGVHVPTGRQRPVVSDAVRAQLNDTARVRIVGRAGRPTRRLGGIFMITTGTQEEILLVGQDGDDLVVRVRRRAAALRMREPVFRFEDALDRIPPGEALDLDVIATRYGACATVNGVVRCVGRPAMGSTWTLAIEEPASSSFVHRLLDAVTILVLALPFGLLLRSVARRQAVAAGVTLAVALPFIAWTSGLALPSLWEWAGVLLAVGAGLAVNKSVRRARAT